MKTALSRYVGVTALTCLLVTIMWLAFLILDQITTGPLETIERVYDYVDSRGGLFYLTYVNAGLVTITAMMFFTGLFLELKTKSAFWALVAFGFTPVYGVLNLVVYLSQVTIVPRLISQFGQSNYSEMSRVLIPWFVQAWPDSVMAVINSLAYAILGIPSVIFGVLLAPSGTIVRIGGVLLIFNGVACVSGFVGVVMGQSLLRQGTLIGGILFLFALAAFSTSYLKDGDMRSER